MFVCIGKLLLAFEPVIVRSKMNVTNILPATVRGFLFGVFYDRSTNNQLDNPISLFSLSLPFSLRFSFSLILSPLLPDWCVNALLLLLWNVTSDHWSFCTSYTSILSIRKIKKFPFSPAGRWHCDNCSICSLCGTRNAEGYPNLSLTKPQRRKLAASAAWNHQYRINELNSLREHIGMWCEPCTRLNENT